MESNPLVFSSSERTSSSADLNTAKEREEKSSKQQLGQTRRKKNEHSSGETGSSEDPGSGLETHGKRITTKHKQAAEAVELPLSIGDTVVELPLSETLIIKHEIAKPNHEIPKSNTTPNKKSAKITEHKPTVSVSTTKERPRDTYISESAPRKTDKRVELSTWHRIEIDKKTGMVSEAPQLAYGKEFTNERVPETVGMQDLLSIASASGQLAVSSVTTVGVLSGAGVTMFQDGAHDEDTPDENDEYDNFSIRERVPIMSLGQSDNWWMAVALIIILLLIVFVLVL